MNKNELHEIGKQSISRFKDMELINPRYAVELELDFWEQEIFPLCQQYGVPKYQFVLEEILMKVGFVNLLSTSSMTPFAVSVASAQRRM